MTWCAHDPCHRTHGGLCLYLGVGTAYECQCNIGYTKTFKYGVFLKCEGNMLYLIMIGIYIKYQIYKFIFLQIYTILWNISVVYVFSHTSLNVLLFLLFALTCLQISMSVQEHYRLVIQCIIAQVISFVLTLKDHTSVIVGKDMNHMTMSHVLVSKTIISGTMLIALLGIIF